MARIEITRPSKEAAREIGAHNWAVWSRQPSRFDWHYDEEETCYILGGEATVTSDEQTVEIGPGDLVVFPGGLGCVWDVKAPIRKRYKMG